MFWWQIAMIAFLCTLEVVLVGWLLVRVITHWFENW